MKYDVTIVGAGPAGSTTAKFLAEKGFKVLLIDKNKFPRDKPCGGGLSSRVLDRFRYVDNWDFIESYGYGGIAFSSSLKYKLEMEEDKPIVAMALRKNFDYKLVKLAVKNGAVLEDGKTVEDTKILKDKVKIFLDDGSSIDSEILVGADGVWSTVAKKMGLRQKNIKIGICVLQEYKLDEETLDRFFGKSRFCYTHTRFQDLDGYGWVFPKKEHLNIGVGEILTHRGSSTKNNLLKVYEEYIKTLKKDKIIPENIKVEKCKGGALPVVPLEKTYCDRVILVGDAAGFINPISGEGIYYAMSSGEIAASIISEALEKGKTNEQFLSKYQKAWKKDFGKDLNLLYQTVKKRGINSNEKLFRVASNDKKLSELLIKVVMGQLSLQKYKWKIIRRYLYALIKNKFSQKQ